MTKKEIQEKCKVLLTGVELTERDKTFLLQLLLKHPRSADKIGCGVKDFFVGKGCFWVTRLDNSITDFSYIKCLREKDYLKEDFAVCCRRAITDYMFDMKLKLYNEQNKEGLIICPISGEQVDFSNIHIDHYRPKFREIVAIFLKDNNITPTQDMIARGDKQLGLKFKDNNLADKFLNYHNKIATFRLLSKTSNIAIG